MYVSCRYAPPTPMDLEALPIGQKQIVCLDTEGREWWLTEDSDVGDYKLFIADGGTIEPYDDTPEGAPV